MKRFHYFANRLGAEEIAPIHATWAQLFNLGVYKSNAAAHNASLDLMTATGLPTAQNPVFFETNQCVWVHQKESCCVQKFF